MGAALLDFETYSEAGYGLPHTQPGKGGIGTVGAAVYARHPSTRVVCLAYQLPGADAPTLWTPGLPLPFDLFLHVAQGGQLQAHNAAFERWIWERVCTARMGWPPVPPEAWRCTMARARAWGLPPALGKVSEVLGLDAQKDAAGKALIREVCVPKKDGKPPRAGALPSLYEYCRQDVAVEGAIAATVSELTPMELEVWQTHDAINRRGVAVDVESLRAFAALLDGMSEWSLREIAEVTTGAVTSPTQVARLQEWLHGRGVHLDSLDEERVAAALELDLPADVRRALDIRRLFGAASVKKVFAMLNRHDPETGRMYDLYHYHAARTGRVTGDGPQPTNLKRSGPDIRACGAECGAWYSGEHRACPNCGDAGLLTAGPQEWGLDAVDFACATARTGSEEFFRQFFPDPLAAIGGCLRGMYVAAPGHDLIGSDYSAIEAVVLAELAGESWRQELFRGHGKIYEASAARILGVDVSELLEYRERTGKHHPARNSIGKVAELGLGYQGWIGAWKAFNGPGTDEEIKRNILAWRAASPSIPEFWGGQTRNWEPCLYGIEGAVVWAIRYAPHPIEVRGHRVQVRDDVLYIRLLSGRELAYHRPRLSPSERRRGESAITYEGWNTNPLRGKYGWLRMQTWGGKLVENIVQATARDIQWHGIVALERAGYPVVLHVYDEDVCEVPQGWGSIEEMERVMGGMPPWALGWPIRATGGWRGRRFRK